MATIRRNWTRFLPHFEFRMTIPFIDIAVAFCYESIEQKTILWVAYDVTFWKWRNRFRIYSPWEMIER